MASFLDPSSSLPARCREIPQAPGPKKGVLALLAMNPATYMSQVIAFGVTDEFFFLPGHQILWQLFLARYNANLPLDIISATQALADMHQLDVVGGAMPGWQLCTRPLLPEPFSSITCIHCGISLFCVPSSTRLLGPSRTRFPARRMWRP